MHNFLPNNCLFLLPVCILLTSSQIAANEYSETKQQTLEQIAAAFGDEVVEHPTNNAAKGNAEHIEAADDA